MAYIQTIWGREATGELAETFAQMAARPMPPAYRAPHGDAPGIVRAHSLDPALMRLVFGASATLHAGDALTWAQRELLAAVTSSTNQCVY